MMFGSVNLDRKPKEKWHQCGVTGFNAQGWEGSLTGVNLPRDIPADQRELVLWAFEQGQWQGKQAGEQSMRDKFKRLLDL